MKQSFTASVWQEGTWWIAQCREAEVASQGESEAEALQNLSEALQLYFSTQPSVLPQVLHIDVELDAN